MNTVKQNTMVPYESIDPAGAGALRPGVSFFVSKKTIAEVIVEKGLCSSPQSMVAKAGSANGRKISKAEAEHICALADGETATADIELALAALQTADGHQALEAYQRIGEVLRSYATPDMSPNFAAPLAARLDEEAADGQCAPVTGKAKPALGAPPLLERTSLVFPDPKQQES
jgi:sigma-E factor negative regulatory protein RseA